MWVIDASIRFHDALKLVEIGLLDDADAVDGEVAVGSEFMVTIIEIGFAGAAILNRHLTADSGIEGLGLATSEAQGHATKERHTLTIAGASYERMHANLAYDERLIAILRVLCGNLLHITHER